MVTIYVHAELSATSESVARLIQGASLRQGNDKVQVKAVHRSQPLSKIDRNYRQWTAKKFVAALKSDKMVNALAEQDRPFLDGGQVHVFVTPLDEQSFYEILTAYWNDSRVVVLIEGVFTPVLMLAESDFEVFASRDDVLKFLCGYFKE